MTHDHNPRELEFSTGGSVVNAFKSLAKSRNLSLRTVLAAAERNDLASIVEMRDYGKERKIEARNLGRLEHLYRQKLLGLKLERDALLRQRAR